MSEQCPKCGYERPAEAESCPACGVIFSRIHQSPVHRTDAGGTRRDTAQRSSLIADYLLAVKAGQAGIVIIIKAAFLLALAIYGGRLIAAPIVSNVVGDSFMHLINLPFHEAGHIIFSPFGRLIQVLGGTLGQFLIPAIVVIAFLMRHDTYSASVGFWWLGESMLDISPYIDDARAGQLMLLGGVTGSEVEDYHDWEVILTKLGMMQYDHALARIVFTLGSLIIVSAVLWGGYILWKEYAQRDRF